MASKSKIPENLVIRHLEAFVQGKCFLCRNATDDPLAVLHGKCAVAYHDEKQKRIKSAWLAAEKECDNKPEQAVDNPQ